MPYSLIIVIVIPFIAAQTIKFMLNKELNEKAKDLFSSLQICFLSLAVFCIFASQGKLLFENLDSVLTIFVPLMLFFIANTIIDLILSVKINFIYSQYSSLTITTLARNSPLALAIAINSFPGHELISIVYIVSKFCLWIKDSELFFV